jgi:hypothetical protein
LSNRATASIEAERGSIVNHENSGVEGEEVGLGVEVSVVEGEVSMLKKIVLVEFQMSSLAKCPCGSPEPKMS